jgi:hypothetical protein
VLRELLVAQERVLLLRHVLVHGRLLGDDIVKRRLCGARGDAELLHGV